MSNEKFNLGELLNDDSFISWVKQDSQLSESEKDKWDDWLSSDKNNKQLLRRAEKLIEMPFKSSELDCDLGELHRLKEEIKSEDGNSKK